MTELSYSQNLEDYHLWLALGARPHGFYIDIGAGHPVADNVSFWFYERGWSGICVEPQPGLAELYAHIRPRDILFDGLVGRQSGEIDFHVVERLHGLSTTVERHARAAEQYGAGYRSVRLPVRTLAEICRAYDVDTIDFLKIDVEGTEADVLAGNDWQAYRPKVVVAEAIEPGSNEPAWQAWESILLTNGYTFTLFDELNRFYVANEAEDVLARAPRQRADWGAVRHMYEIGRAPENELHPEHGLARELLAGFLAGLPRHDPASLAAIIAGARGQVGEADVNRLLQWLQSDQGRAALGRIACGYDGGQIIED